MRFLRVSRSFILLIFIVFSLILAGCTISPGNSSTETSSSSSSGGADLIFNDNFDRDDSSTVGNGWYQRPGAVYAINSHKLSLTGSSSTLAVVGKTTASFGNFVYSLTFIQDTKFSFHMDVCRSSDGCAYTASIASDNTIGILRDSTVLLADTFTVAAGASYSVCFSKSDSTITFAITNLGNTADNKTITSSDNTYPSLNMIWISGGEYDFKSSTPYTTLVDDVKIESL